MKKIISLFFVGSMVLIAIFATPTQDKYDFRNSNWGDTLQEVIQAEGRYPDDDFLNEFEYDLDGNPYFDEVTFYFGVNNTLYSASYSIPADRKISYSVDSGKYESSIDEFQKTTNEERIDLIRDRLTAKYGIGKSGQIVDILENTESDLLSLPSIVMIWDMNYTYWITEDTVILLYIDDDFEYSPYVFYLSRFSKKADAHAVSVYLDALI